MPQNVQNLAVKPFFGGSWFHEWVLNILWRRFYGLKSADHEKCLVDLLNVCSVGRMNFGVM